MRVDIKAVRLSGYYPSLYLLNAIILPADMSKVAHVFGFQLSIEAIVEILREL